jgi:hypothetical protein
MDTDTHRLLSLGIAGGCLDRITRLHDLQDLKNENI